MSPQRGSQDQAAINRQLVIAEVFRRPGVSRTEIGRVVGLNVASVSRITRDLIDCGLVRETERFGPDGRPGRKFVGLAPRAEGGYVVGVGINAFRQSVALADLENHKIDEWISPTAPGEDGEAFLRICLEKADAMLKAHAIDRRRFFGVGLAVTADLDKENGAVLRAPVFQWKKPIDVAGLARDILGASIVLETPPAAINKAEADLSTERSGASLATLYCSLGFGICVRRADAGQRLAMDVDGVLTQSRTPDGGGLSLSESCGGISILSEILGAEAIRGRAHAELGPLLLDVIGRSDLDEGLRALLREKGRLTAQYMALIFELMRPEQIVLAGPLAGAPDYVSGFRDGLGTSIDWVRRAPEIRCSAMTHTSASRWLALRGNVIDANLDLNAMKPGDAA